MRRIAYALGLLASGLCVFGWWGLFTASGQQQFDEMAGMIPVIAGGAGIAVGVLTLALLIASVGRRSADEK